MAFLDEDDPFPPVAEERAGSSRTPPARQREYMVRRLAAVGIGLLIVILLVLGVRGCLNARKERAYENYLQDLAAVASDSKQLSEGFFDRLEDPKRLTKLQFESEIKSDRSSAQALLTRAEGLDAPDSLSGAQNQLELAFRLRLDGLTGVAEQVGTALGDEGRSDALDSITLDMQDFLASDVLYRRAAAEADSVIQQENISCDGPDGCQVPESVFLPSNDWLDETTVAEALAQVTGQGGAATSGVHGLGLTQVLARPGDVPLTEDTPATVTGGGTPEIEVSVQNQGDQDETDVVITFSIDNGEIDGEQTIQRIAAGETRSVTIPLQPEPPKGEELSLEVTAEPVAGEQVVENNSATYMVTFE